MTFTTKRCKAPEVLDGRRGHLRGWLALHHIGSLRRNPVQVNIW
jgi:hypothetical protein